MSLFLSHDLSTSRSKPEFKLMVAAVAISALLACSMAHSAPKKKNIVAMFEFAVNGRHVPFFVAKEKGYYKEQGLEVELVPGSGQGITLNTVAAGKADFGIGDSLLLAQSVQSKAGVKAVLVLSDKHPAGFASWTKDNINTVKDFEGKTISHAIGGAFKDLLRITMEINKANYGKVKVIDVAPAVMQTLFLDGKVDLATNTYEFYGFLEAQAGPGKTRFLMLADHGLNIYGYLVYARTDVLRDDPDMVRAFVSATLRGMRDAMRNSDEAASILVKYNPNLKLPGTRVQAARWAELNKEAKVLGRVDAAKMDETLRVSTRALDITSAPKADELYTNEFLPR